MKSIIQYSIALPLVAQSIFRADKGAIRCSSPISLLKSLAAWIPISYYNKLSFNVCSLFTICSTIFFFRKAFVQVSDTLPELSHHIHTVFLPLCLVLEGIRQVFITRYTKDTTISQLLCQWDNVEVKKAELPLVPKFSWVSFHAAFQISSVELPIKFSIPFSINMPVLPMESKKKESVVQSKSWDRSICRQVKSHNETYMV